jgi:hypothetical protein
MRPFLFSRSVGAEQRSALNWLVGTVAVALLHAKRGIEAPSVLRSTTSLHNVLHAKLASNNWDQTQSATG